MRRGVVIILGPPGAGKGTQAELLAEKLNLYLFETSKILENRFKEIENFPLKKEERFVKINGKKFDILEEKRKWQEGKLCSPPFVTFLVVNEIKKLFEAGKNLVLSGSPRTLYEAKKILPILENLYDKKNIRVILLEISPQETIFRNSHRKICQLMRHSILFNKETENLTHCPLDGSLLIKRKIDTPEIIKVRIREYQKKTLPILSYFQKNKIRIHKIKGERSVAQVFEDILRALK